MALPVGLHHFAVDLNDGVFQPGLHELQRLHRVIATHLGDGEVTVDEFLGHAIEPVGGTMYGSEELRAALRRHSFRVDRTWYRESLPHEHPSRRIYLIGRRDDG